MDIVYLIISLISGAVGGNIAGSSMPDKNFGVLGNTIAGLLGGGVGDFVLKALGVLATTQMTGTAGPDSAASGLDITSILATIGAGGVGGGALTAIAAFIKDAIQKK